MIVLDPPPSDNRLHTGTSWIALFACAAAIAVAGTALWSRRDLDASVGSAAVGQSIPMAPGTAALIIGMGIALILREAAPHRSAARFTLVAVAGVSAFSGAGVIARDLLDWLRASSSAPLASTGAFQIPLGRMSPITAGLFVLLSIALILLASRDRWTRTLGHGAVAAGTLFCGIIVLAYTTGAPLFYGRGIVPVAWSTALALGALNVAMLFMHDTPERLSLYVFGLDEAAPAPATSKSERRAFAAYTSALVMVVIGVAAWYLHSYRQREQQQLRATLTSIADLKRKDLVGWREGQIRMGQLLSRAPYLLQLLPQSASQIRTGRQAAELRAWMQHLRATENYTVVALFDASGTPIIAEPELAMPGTSAVVDAVREAMQAGQVVLRDFQGPPAEPVHLDLIAPVRNDATQRSLGAMMLRIDPDTFVYPLLRNWPTPSATAETLLVRREGDEVMYLNNPRHWPDHTTPLRLPALSPALLSARVLRGEHTLISDSVDYRAEPVLGIGHRIPDTDWALIAKMDQSEAYASMRRHSLAVLLIVGALAGAITLGAGLVWRQRRMQGLRTELAAQHARETLAKRLALVMENANDAIFMLTEDGRILEANQRAATTYGYSIDELQTLSISDLRTPASLGLFSRHMEAANTPAGVCFESEHRRKDGSVFPVEVSSRVAELNGRRFRFSVIRDIRLRKENEAQIERLNRLYAALSEINQAVARARSQGELFADVCRALVDTSRFKLAWIGWTNPLTQRIEPVAHHGDDGDYLASVPDFADDRPEGRGPAATAVREGRPYVCNDFALDEHAAPWRQNAERNGLHAAIALPLSQDGHCVGALTVYASAPHVFNEKEVALCNEAGIAVTTALEKFAREKRQRASDERVGAAFQTSPDAFVIVERSTGRIFEVNDRMVELYGFSKEEMIGRTSLELGMWADADTRQKVLAELKAKGRVENFEVHARRKNGETFWVHYSVADLKTDGMALYLGVIHDVTDRKRLSAVDAARLHISQYAVTHSLDEFLEESLNEAEKLTESRIGFFHFVEADQQTLALQNWSTRTKAEYCRAQGKGQHYPISQAGVWVECVRVGRPVIHNDYATLPNRQGLPPGHAQLIRELVVPVLRSGVVKAILGVGNKATGYGEKDIESLSQLAELAWEIADRKRVEEELREAEKLYRGIFEGAAEGIFRTTGEGRLLAGNSALARILGYESTAQMLQDVVDTGSQVWLRKDDRRRFTQLLATSAVQDFETQFKRLDGTPIWVSLSGRRAMARDGDPLFFEGFVSDITERKRLELDVRERERLLATMFENASVGIAYTDARAGMQRTNRHLRAMLECSESDLLGVDFRDYANPDDYAKKLVEMERIRRGESSGFSLEMQFRARSGRGLWGRLSVTALRENDAVLKGFVLILDDITERRQARETLLQFNAELEARVATRTAELRARTTELEELAGRLARESEERRQAEERSQINQKQLRTLVDNLHTLVFMKDRTGRYLLVNPFWEKATGLTAAAVLGKTDRELMASEIAEPLMARDRQVMETGEPLAVEETIPGPDGVMRLYLSTTVPLFDEQGRTYGLCGIATDITVRRKVERDMQANLERERQLSEMKSRFLSIASHEFRTPLAAAVGSLELLERHAAQLTDAKRSELIARTHRSLARLTAIMNDVLSVSRADSGRVAVRRMDVDLVRFVQDVMHEAEIGDRQQHRFHFARSGQPDVVPTDTSLLHHILSNLLGNAVRYSPAGTLVSVTLAIGDAAFILTVADEGIGIPVAERERVFEPFVRGSNASDISGTGLGLNIVKRYTELMGGRVELLPVETGATFRVEVPFHEPR